jgi:adhesin HecA-like repeat protein
MLLLVTISFSSFGGANLMADERLVIDDRRSGELKSVLGPDWRMFSDSVMGGISRGSLTLDTIDSKSCLRLRGDVSLDNNGGFIQAALDIERTEAADASGYQGLLLEVYGNGEEYNLHLRTDDVWLPWQSYRASFQAPTRWQSVKLPFKDFSGYRIGKRLDLKHLKRIGIVAIGREFTADLCIATLALYRETD